MSLFTNVFLKRSVLILWLNSSLVYTNITFEHQQGSVFGNLAVFSVQLNVENGVKKSHPNCDHFEKKTFTTAR